MADTSKKRSGLPFPLLRAPTPPFRVDLPILPPIFTPSPFVPSPPLRPLPPPPPPFLLRSSCTSSLEQLVSPPPSAWAESTVPPAGPVRDDGVASVPIVFRLPLVCAAERSRTPIWGTTRTGIFSGGTTSRTKICPQYWAAWLTV